MLRLALVGVAADMLTAENEITQLFLQVFARCIDTFNVVQLVQRVGI